ncbi:DUF6491 family protein [Asticcacaulis benevestitus]|nr:DUF6491 family protein [Asticcacaulis benevestitus]
MTNKTYLAGFAAAGLLAGALAITALSGAASVSAREARDDDRASTPRQAPKCLDGRNIGRTHMVDDHTLLVYDTWGNPYKLDVRGPCRSMNDFSTVGFEFNGSDQICKAHDAKILRSENGSRPVKCLINGVESISREEADALDKG